MNKLLFLFLSIIILLSSNHLNLVLSAQKKQEFQFNPHDWNFIADLKNSLRSITLERMNPLLYGLSMAAGLAMGVSLADSPPVSSFINRLDNRISKHISPSNILHRDQHVSGSEEMSQTSSPSSSLLSGRQQSSSSLSGLPNHPVIQKNIAVSKDGQDHYHHVVHYHIPYPLSMGAFNTAKSLYPSNSWYISETPGSAGKPVVVSGYMGSAGTRTHSDQSPFSSSDPFSASQSMMNAEETRRNDVRVHSSSAPEHQLFSTADVQNYFKSVPKSLRKKLIRNGNANQDMDMMTIGRSLSAINNHNLGNHNHKDDDFIGSSPLLMASNHRRYDNSNHIGAVFVPASSLSHHQGKHSLASPSSSSAASSPEKDVSSSKTNSNVSSSAAPADLMDLNQSESNRKTQLSYPTLTTNGGDYHEPTATTSSYMPTLLENIY